MAHVLRKEKELWKMKITCTQDEKDWVIRCLADSECCGIDAADPEHCLCEHCEECIEKNVKWEIENESEECDGEQAVPQDDVADVMNLINDALSDTKYMAVGYDNTGYFLMPLIDKKTESEVDVSLKCGNKAKQNKED